MAPTTLRGKIKTHWPRLRYITRADAAACCAQEFDGHPFETITNDRYRAVKQRFLVRPHLRSTATKNVVSGGIEDGQPLIAKFTGPSAGQ